MLAFLIALAVQSEIADLSVCGADDPLLLSEEQRNCVANLSAKLLENRREFLVIEWPDIVLALATSPHRCLGQHNHNIEPVWPRDEGGANINIQAPVIVSLSYDVDEQGRVRNAEGNAHDATLPQDTLSEFVLAAESAVSLWRYATCEGHNPATKGRTTELHFVMGD